MKVRKKVSISLPLLSEILFGIFAVVLFFLSFLLGDTFYRWIILPGLIVSTWVACKVYKKNALHTDILLSKSVASIFFVWLGLIIWLTISAFFTKNIGLSLDFLLSQTTVFLLFSFVLVRPKQFHAEEFAYALITLLILVGVVLSFLSFGFMFSPFMAAQLPGFNLLHANYGHNHLASYLILVLPLSWWFSLRTKSVISVLISIFLSISLATSFGRVAVFIGLLQLLAIVWVISKTNFVQGIQRKYLRLVGTSVNVLVALFLAVLVFKAFFSVTAVIFPSLSSAVTCPIPQLRMQLCKPIATETRPEYWNQALQGFMSEPFFGYGPGTFALVSNRFTSHPSKTTAFAHNAPLQFLAESGLIGGVAFSALLVLIVFVIFKRVTTSRDPLLQISIFISLASLFINNIFDFDWSFVGIASTVALLVAVSLTEDTKEKQKKIKNSWYQQWLSPVVYGTFLVQICIILLITAAIAYAELLFIKKDYHALLYSFPYASHHRVALATYDSWKDQDLDRLFKINAWHPHSLELLLSNYFAYPAWQEQYTQLASISFGFSHTKLLFFDWSNTYLSLEEQITAYNEIFHLVKQEQDSKEFYRYFPLRTDLLLNYIGFANQLYAHGDIDTAADMYLLAFELDEWILSNSDIAFLVADSNSTTNSPSLEFMRKLVGQVGDKLGYNSDDFSNIYIDMLDLDSEYLLEDVKNIISIAPWHSYELWRLTSGYFESQLEKPQIPTDQNTQRKLTQRWLAIWEQLEQAKTNSDWDLEYEHKSNLVRSIFDVVNQDIPDEEKMHLVSKVQKILPFDYIAMAQLGHMYMSLEKTEEAEIAYRECLTAFKIAQQNNIFSDLPTHYECQTGLNLLEQGINWPTRFTELVKINNGEADWDDFGS